MGTFGSGLLDSDTAIDFVEALHEVPPKARLKQITVILDSAAASGTQSVQASPLPEEVVAAVAVLVANMNQGEFSWPAESDVPLPLLTGTISPTVANTARVALSNVSRKDGWWWNSWVDDQERALAYANIEALIRALD
ncbi:DUF4259 domain-containing protein [Stackebrandtia endophytica]|uniref:DUF4259 domain-containing protein n=1 Tax=Stackebrandtia endophytica TaxID=1496996 RepID=UPI001476A1F5|nr:DUF4259 domain-containing protein [Stackebrandtia endophytica]